MSARLGKPQARAAHDIVTLVMPRDVAVTLASLMSYVSGGMASSYRAQTDAIAEALNDAGIRRWNISGRFEGGVRASELPSVVHEP